MKKEDAHNTVKSTFSDEMLKKLVEVENNKTRKRSNAGRKPKASEDEILKAYISLGVDASYIRVAKMLDVSRNRVANIVKRALYEAQEKENKERAEQEAKEKRNAHKNVTLEQVQNLLKEHKTQIKVAEILGVSRQFVGKVLKQGKQK